MPVQVHVPVTLKLPEGRQLAAADLADLEVGAGDALARAFDIVREEVLTPRGRHRHVNVGDPTVRFESDLDEALRAGVELAVQRAIAHAVARSELRSWYRPDRSAAALTGPASAWRDPARRGDGDYRIQFFDDGTPGSVTVTEGEGFEVTYGEAAPEPQRPLSDEDAVIMAWEGHLRRYGPLWDPAVYGYPGFYGDFTHRGVALKGALVYIWKVGPLDEEGWPSEWWWQIDDFAMLGYSEEDEEVVHNPLHAAMGHWVLTKTTEAVTFENILARATEHAQRLPAEMRVSDAAREAMARFAAEEAAKYPNTAIYTVEDGQYIYDVLLEPGTEGVYGIAHSPIRFIAQGALPGAEQAEGAGGEREGAGRQGEEEGAGGEGGGREGGRGRRPRGGPLGTGVGHGAVWPTLGIGGEKLVCEPFLGEPPVEQLVEGGEALAAEMRDVCSALELDYCGYAGKLCINLARVLAARAHAIGVTSINSTITTAVTARPDGGGNNAFVDIRPGSSPELTYMEALGDLVVQVNNLANNISRTYMAQANQHLIYWDEDHDFDPNAAAWSLRFWGQMSELLPDACMWLYAETCRIILLQQLRSSHSGIVARQDQFPETLRRFDEALGILGESVVKLSVLKQAIAHADRYDLTGSVRSVLSHRPPVRYYGREREPYQPPAPIESMASQVIDVLAGATIEEQGDGHVARYDNRVWTTSDLEQGVGLRRSILNMVDPLFLQIPDLDRLFHEFRRNPSSSERYLTDLLKQMREANEEMTREASDWEEGAFFALEASQWVAAEGGVNAQGLHYDLQGLHKLADDVLRPWVGSLGAYNDGVDKAISIKANWDRFKQIFAVVGIIALALLCAPLGAIAVGVVTGIAGLALTLDDVAEANRLEALYRSLEDPEAILSWQDVQLARLMADLSIAFSIFDVIGVGKGAKAIISGARTALREVAEQGLRATVRASIQATRRTILANMAEDVLRNAVRQAAQQAAIAVTMQAVLPVVITPVLVPWIRGVALEHGTLGQVDAALGELTQGQPATPTVVREPLPADVGVAAAEEAPFDPTQWYPDPGAEIDPAEWYVDPATDGGTVDVPGASDQEAASP